MCGFNILLLFHFVIKYFTTPMYCLNEYRMRLVAFPTLPACILCYTKFHPQLFVTNRRRNTVDR